MAWYTFFTTKPLAKVPVQEIVKNFAVGFYFTSKSGSGMVFFVELPKIPQR